MHELSIAMSLIDVITETLIREDATGASRVGVEVGALSGVVPEALQTAFTTATRGTELDGCVLEIVEVRATITCDACGASREVRPDNLACPACGARQTRVVRGRELDVVRIETR